MQMLLHRRDRHRFARMRWLGRCGAMRIIAANDVNQVGSTKKAFFTIIGVHGGLSEETLSESLADASALYRHRCRPCSAAIIGDFNVDLLPTCANDTWRNDPCREHRHAEQRIVLQSMLEALKLHVGIPDFVETPPPPPTTPGTFSVDAATASITRIPQSDSAGRERAATLDYAVMDSAARATISIDWKYAPADHGWVEIRLDMPEWRDTRKQQSTWRPSSYEEAKQDLANITTGLDIYKAKWSDIIDYLTAWQNKWATTTTAKERRRARVPMQARSLHKKADEHDKKRERTDRLTNAGKKHGTPARSTTGARATRRSPRTTRRAVR